jgi:Fe-S cluster biosynthesis and repair protein YggX
LLIKKIRDEKRGVVCNVPEHEKIEEKMKKLVDFIFGKQDDEIEGVVPLEKIKNHLTKTKEK